MPFARFWWSFLGSILINIAMWIALAAYLFPLHLAESGAPREIFKVSSITLHAKRRTVRTPQPQSLPEPVDNTEMAPPQPATLALPSGWSKQDFGFLGTTDASIWLDRTEHRGKWIPRVFLWDKKVEPGYMQRTSMRDALKEILDSLHDEHAVMYASRAHRVCNGLRAGWFLSYSKPEDDPPLHFDETLFMANDTVYRATYIRAVDQPEDSKARAALDTLCWP
jgi:hypothetical protein